ncbi:T9SS type B sorting domain-containing protein [Flavobacterium sharifuzzamanii]|uniref:T9SS type B sorting domain-containing protein n=1 Tax=Flavobacterium sharifuzzamanii TaxID=2211133 RepID=UPI000DAE89F7|nr:T9SS type B sorting domain-containing protein [Flavobacterium sharifuzzamanii]KAF2079139.1 T9SS type B sorting domain-containing protein [Flavobacterium sharifuzzamanii]
MKQKLLFFFLFYSFLMQSQCFDCAKVYAGWIGGAVFDLEKTDNAVFVTIGTHLSGANRTDRPGLYKYDLNCNLLWKKEFPSYTAANYFCVDDQGNSYVLVKELLGGNYNSGREPFVLDGLQFYFGVTLYKLSPNGNVVWNRKIGTINNLAKNVYYNNGYIYVTGSFNNSININNQILLSDNAYYGRAFVAKFDIAGNLIDAKKYGSDSDVVKTSEIDKNGNIYFGKIGSNYTSSSIFKVNSNLEMVWSKEISNNGNILNKTVYRPTILHYNPINDKLYLWGCFDRDVNVLGNTFNTNSPRNDVTQSILTEFNPSNGNLERFKQINNNSMLEYPGEANLRPSSLNKAYMAGKGNELFVFTSFSNTMTFPNANITSRNLGEDLVLFKMNLDNFEPEYVLKSTGTNHYANSLSLDAAGPIKFDKDDLFLTSNFQSEPLIINNSVIYGNSGNNEANGLLYKLKSSTSPPNKGEILAENTCFNKAVNFNVKGTFDSILWNFDDPNSNANNTAAINNPQHQFTAIGTYTVAATIKCGSETQTITKEITITNSPNDFTLNPIYSCEGNSGSGISNSFNTSGIHAIVIGNQSDLIVEYTNQSGVSLPSPLPNPYTNTVKNEEIITVKSYFKTNPSCFIEKDFKLIIISKPQNPTGNSPQIFCMQQNATINDIQITGQNIKWYSAQTAGTILSNITPLQNGVTYYASQTINGCESERAAVLINIQNTLAPTGNANQPFCTGQNPTILNIEITGTSIKWYDSPNNGTLLSETTNLQNGKTYYASQTENSCESPRFGVTVSLVNTPSVPSGNPEQSFCKKENKTLNDIQIMGQSIKWFDTMMSASTLPNTTLLENNRTYYASQKIGCDSDRIPILVHVYDTPIPIGSKNQQFCIDELATIENLNIAGTALKWYDAPINGNILNETTLLKNGTYYVTQTANNCESERLAITVKIQDTPIPIADSPQQFCIQKSSKISDIEINGQNIKWYESSSSTSNLSESTSLENGITYYASQTVSTCESDRIPVTINILEATAGDCIHLVNELPFLKFFTPNGDGFNDTWTIDPDYLAPNSSIRIFDRYGRLIKELALNTSWNGTYLGNQQPASDYWFTVTRINGTEYRGHFSLKR